MDIDDTNNPEDLDLDLENILESIDDEDVDEGEKSSTEDTPDPQTMTDEEYGVWAAEHPALARKYSLFEKGFRQKTTEVAAERRAIAKERQEMAAYMRQISEQAIPQNKPQEQAGNNGGEKSVSELLSEFVKTETKPIQESLATVIEQNKNLHIKLLERDIADEFKELKSTYPVVKKPEVEERIKSLMLEHRSSSPRQIFSQFILEPAMAKKQAAARKPKAKTSTPSSTPVFSSGSKTPRTEDEKDAAIQEFIRQNPGAFDSD